MVTSCENLILLLGGHGEKGEDSHAVAWPDICWGNKCTPLTQALWSRENRRETAGRVDGGGSSGPYMPHIHVW